ncbi:uncharacterized protein LOC125038873 [Penaeus chinensis]|uniref:uncharacterized protein LOC125038873 n=1 Tax=Penaeus chinensis TaxID=139456 RepID=UPI001FB6D04E|nr:uncharacterized protein LOC125038873 [Penaeus chinensis]
MIAHACAISQGGRPCRVYSEALNLDVSCDEAEKFIAFGSVNEAYTEVASNFALPCEYLPQDSACNDRRKRNAPPGLLRPAVFLPSLFKPILDEVAVVGLVTLNAIALVLFICVVVLLLCVVALVVVKVRKSRSSREAAIAADDLHDPGRDDDREDEHIYCSIDVDDLRPQLEEERRATHAQPGGGKTGVRRCNSENSLYGAVLPRVRRNSENSSKREILPRVSLRKEE